MTIVLMMILFSDPNCVVFSHFDGDNIIFERACGLQDIPRVLARHWLQHTEYCDYGYGASLGDGFVNWIDFVRWQIVYLEFLEARCVTYSKVERATNCKPLRKDSTGATDGTDKSSETP